MVALAWAILTVASNPRRNLQWWRSIKLQGNWFFWGDDARNRALLLRLGGEQQRVALGAAGIGGTGRLGLGDVLGEDRDRAYAAPVRGDDDFVGLVLGHAEFRLQDGDDKFAGREVVERFPLRSCVACGTNPVRRYRR